jgi:hypothetical protein
MKNIHRTGQRYCYTPLFLPLLGDLCSHIKEKGIFCILENKVNKTNEHDLPMSGLKLQPI